VSVEIRTRLGRHVPGDITLLLAAFGLLCAYSLATLWSVTEGIHGPYAVIASGLPKALFWRQVVWVGLAWLVLVAALRAPLQWYEEAAPFAYLLVLLLLLLVLVAGPTVAGARRWFALGPVHLQPSELAKVAAILILARWLGHHDPDDSGTRPVAGATLLALLPALLVLREPDLGTSLVFVAVWLVMLFWWGLSGVLLLSVGSPLLSAVLSFVSGEVLESPWPWGGYILVLVVVLWVARLRFVESILLLAANIVTGVGVSFLWGGLKTYQQERILTFFNPGRDTFGAGYQTIQSKVAIGSGGLFGTGYLQGTQKGLAFLPERHTDFIFSVIGEELGFVGAVVLIGLFALLLWKTIRIAERARRPFSSLVAIGVAGYLGFHVVVNLMITTGLLPVTGLPLPVISYGGSNLLVTALLVGLVANIGSRSFET